MIEANVNPRRSLLVPIHVRVPSVPNKIYINGEPRDVDAVFEYKIVAFDFITIAIVYINLNRKMFRISEFFVSIRTKCKLKHLRLLLLHDLQILFTDIQARNQDFLNEGGHDFFIWTSNHNM